MELDFNLRPADPGDLPQLAHMVEQLFQHCRRVAPRDPFVAAHDLPSLEERIAAFGEALADRANEVLVAESPAGGLWGFAQGCIQQPYISLPENADVGYIAMVWVDEAHRTEGIGRHLVETLETMLSMRGAKHIELHYLLGNAEAEIFWSELGYTPYRMTAVKTLS